MRVPGAPSVGMTDPSGGGPAFATQGPRIMPSDVQGEQAAGLTGAVKRVGVQAYRVATVLQERLDVAQAKKGANALSDAYREMMETPEGYLNQIGEGAIKGRDRMLDALRAKRDEIADAMQNETQREVFLNATESDFQTARKKADNHFIRQFRAHETAQAGARAQMAEQSAIDAYIEFGADSDEFKDQRSKLFGEEGEINQLLMMQGITGDAAKAARQEAWNRFHVSMLDRLTADGKDPDKAIEYAQGAIADGTLTGDAKSMAIKLVGTADLKRKGQLFVDWAMGRNMSPTELMESMTQMVQRGDTTQEVMDESMRRYVAADSQKQRDEARVKDKAWEKIVTYAQLNGGVLDTEHEQLVEGAGLDGRWKLYKRGGMQWSTDDIGTQAIYGTDPVKLATRWKTREELFEHYREHVSDSDMSKLVGVWEYGQSTMAAGAKAQAKAQQRDPVKFNSTALMVDGLKSAIGVPPETKVDSPTLPKWKVEKWELAVAERLDGIAKDPANPTQSEYRQAMNEVKSDRVYFDAELTEAESRMRIFVKDAELQNTYVRGKDGRPIAVTLDFPVRHPVTGQTGKARDLFMEDLKAEAALNNGIVDLGGGKRININDVSPEDVVRGSMALISAGKVAAQTTGQEWLQRELRVEIRNVIEEWTNQPLYGDERNDKLATIIDDQTYATAKTSGYRTRPSKMVRPLGFLPAAPVSDGYEPVDLQYVPRRFDEDPPARVHELAVERLLQRQSEWKQFQLTRDEVLAIFGRDGPAERAAAEKARVESRYDNKMDRAFGSPWGR